MNLSQPFHLHRVGSADGSVAVCVGGGRGGVGNRLSPSLWAGRDADEPIKKEKDTKSLVVFFNLTISGS